MWVSIIDEPIPTYGSNNKLFILCLSYRKYYGHITKDINEVVVAIWDSTNECFYEKDIGIEIDSRDISMWLKDT